MGYSLDRDKSGAFERFELADKDHSDRDIEFVTEVSDIKQF